ncbi:MAG TPA: hypothetical protein VFG87_29350 [Amycolatopsis sp.]|nr:hypothetical protein [Amycolatopsis sp.]
MPWLAIVLGFLGGLMAVNSLPHFIKGILHESFPMQFGNTPIRNAIAGFVGLVVAGVLLYFANIPAHSGAALIAMAIGGLLSALFHANGGAYRVGEKNARKAVGKTA